MVGAMISGPRSVRQRFWLWRAGVPTKASWPVPNPPRDVLETGVPQVQQPAATEFSDSDADRRRDRRLAVLIGCAGDQPWRAVDVMKVRVDGDDLVVMARIDDLAYAGYREIADGFWTRDEDS